MNKGELIEKLAEKAKACSKAEAGRFLDAFIEIVIDTLKKGDEVAIAGFGVFAPKVRAARTGRNPKTGETISIPATKVPKFRAGRYFKDALK
ncbi:MAG: HU family DNA-binding protein [Patescibacteria group bacterium]